ncbi:MAG: tripartite tricarboxylate transporter TctB family protein [Sphaerochaeta sp.]|jgi:hypothetical protein|nr:tripartite tricarboxylate transporter TctB family protein [Sphaerochaeta sp.]MDX9915828.1 tripartite tricarboxylate transporter TctB family protein [Sphaerochaeta sp.]
MVTLRTNLLSGILAICLGAAILILIPFQIQEELFLAYGQISADFIPKVVSLVMIMLGILLVFQSLILHKEKIISIEAGAFKRAMTFLALTVAYGVLFRWIGFLIPSLLFTTGLLILQRSRQWVYWLICCVFPVVIWVLFNVVFLVKLPLI